MKEEWRAVVGYEGYYEVSDKGRVRSLDRMIIRGKSGYFKRGRILRNGKTSTGYWKVELQVNGVVKSFKVHRLVAFAFIPSVEGKEIINHKDGNPLNNEVSNLEWCTQLENIRHAIENNLTTSNFRTHKHQIMKEYTSGGGGIVEICRNYKCSPASMKKFLESNGVTVKSAAEIKSIYKIDRLEMIKDFNDGMKNKDIAKKHNTNPSLIGRYKYMYKKGELKI